MASVEPDIHDLNTAGFTHCILMHLVISPDNSSSALDRAGGIFYIISSSLNARLVEELEEGEWL